MLHASGFREIPEIPELDIGKLASNQNVVMDFITYQKIKESAYLKPLKCFTLYMGSKLRRHVLGFFQTVFVNIIWTHICSA